MKKIVVAVDFSEATMAACEFGVYLAKATDSSLVLFHTYFDQIIVAGGSYPDTMASQTLVDMKMVNEIKINAEREMAKLIDLVNKLIVDAGGGIPLTSYLEGGDIDYELEEQCKVLSPDLLVIGQQGKGKKSLFGGTMTKRILKHSCVPVMTIPSGYLVKSFEKALVIVDQAHAITEDLVSILAILKPYETDVQCLFLAKGEKAQKEEEEILGKIRVGLERVDRRDIGIEIISGKNEEVMLSDYLHDNPKDLLIIQERRRDWFSQLFRSGLSSEDLLNFEVPLLIFPQK